MSVIVGLGGPSDSLSLSLQTRAQWDIPNHQEVISSKLMRVLHTEFEKDHPKWRLRSLRSGYNCVGMVFGSRRTWIEPDHFSKIAQDDGFRRVTEAQVGRGDLVAYVRQGDVEHIGLIVDKQPDLTRGIFRYDVISKFGKGPEYLHEHDDLPKNLVNPPVSLEFWSERLLP